ncbi:unnamed protein product [Caenorhabditis sp. 36 PRJEB53466]|nr:unnamed protein product [Caenorhabditis sp. 36 PRJEB53466]
MPTNYELTINNEMSIWEFIHKKIIVNREYERVDVDLFEEYKQEHETPISCNKMFKFYNSTMKGRLYKFLLPREHILELYKRLHIEISEHVEQIMEAVFSAILHLNSDRILEDYRFVDAAPRGTGESTQKVRKEPGGDVFDDDEIAVSRGVELQMWKFMSEKFDNSRASRVRTRAFWQEFLWTVQIDTRASATVLAHHFVGEMLPDLWQQNIEPRIKMDMGVQLKVPADTGAQYHLAETDRVEVRVDSQNLVKTWKMMPECLEKSQVSEERNTPKIEEMDESPRRKAFTDAEDRQMWLYISNKLKENGKIKPKGLSFWQKFVNDTKSDRSPSNLSSHYRKKMVPNLHKIDGIKIRDRMQLYYLLDIPIPLPIRISAKAKLGHQIQVDENDVLVEVKRSRKTSEDEEKPIENQEEEEEEPASNKSRRSIHEGMEELVNGTYIKIEEPDEPEDAEHTQAMDSEAVENCLHVAIDYESSCDED